MGSGRWQGWIWRPGLVGWPLAFVLLLGHAGAARAEATVRDIRVAQYAEGTRVVVDLSRKVSFHHITLGSPPRLAIDLPEVAWLVPDTIGRRAVGLVTGFRFGRFRPGVSRLVVDLAGPFEIRRIFELPPNGTSGYRIVTDLAAATTDQLQAATTAQLEGGALPAATQQTAALHVPLPQRPAKKPPFGAEQRLIVIDPGHGGVDPGAIGAAGSFEKDIVLAIALELRRQLEASGRYRVVMTREDDRFVRLRDRLRIARDSQGELFLSLHADSLGAARGISGAAVYTLSEKASDQEAARLARNENRADILGGIDLSDHEDIVTQILIDLAQRDANNKSIRVAELMVKELDEVTAMVRRHRQQAGFVVLKSPDMPSVLIELGYLSNRQEEAALRDSAHRTKLAKALVRAIDHYFAPGSP